MAEPLSNALIQEAISGDTPFVGNFTGTPSASNPAGPGTQVQLGSNPPVTPPNLDSIAEGAGANPQTLADAAGFAGGSPSGVGAGGSPTAPAGTALSDLGISATFGTPAGDASQLPAGLSFGNGGFSPSSIIGQNSGLGLPASVTPGGVGGVAGSNTSVAGSNTPAGSTPTSTSLSPFAGGDVGSFVQWYNNLDPSMATSLFTALQNAQAPKPPAGVPQLTGPVPMTVGS